jgi:hypothetical protein
LIASTTTRHAGRRNAPAAASSSATVAGGNPAVRVAGKWRRRLRKPSGRPSRKAARDGARPSTSLSEVAERCRDGQHAAFPLTHVSAHRLPRAPIWQGDLHLHPVFLIHNTAAVTCTRIVASARFLVTLAPRNDTRSRSTGRC